MMVIYAISTYNPIYRIKRIIQILLTIKNWLKHSVHFTECEEVFFNEPLITYYDEKLPIDEKRYYSLGQTDSGRCLYCVFTLRNNKIRVISVRDMNKKEKIFYEKDSKI